jgi:hypothetical protein
VAVCGVAVRDATAPDDWVKLAALEGVVVSSIDLRGEGSDRVDVRSRGLRFCRL